MEMNAATEMKTYVGHKFFWSPEEDGDGLTNRQEVVIMRDTQHVVYKDKDEL